MTCLFFNCRRSPFDDVEFRRAMSCLVDREFIAKTVLEGWAEPLEVFIPQASHEWTNSNASAKFDLKEARRILEDAGYRIDSQAKKRVDPKTGKPLREMTLLTLPFEDAPGHWATGNATSLYARVLGIPVRHTTLTEYELIVKAMKDRDFDMFVLDIELGHPPFSLYYLLHSSCDKPWTIAYTGIHDSDLDTSLEISGSESRSLKY